MSRIVLETRAVEKVYHIGSASIKALSGVDLQVERGDFISIMGPSGSGKTTLLNILGCLDKPTKGRVLVDGVDVTDQPESTLFRIRREKVGFVFQSFNLLPALNALENVELPMECLKIPRRQRRRRARELLHMVGLSGRERHRPHRLSAGEQQRVAIARALANNPAIVLADEPTGNLDSKTGLEIVRLLGRLTTERQSAVVMVTHDRQMASHAGRIMLLKDGRLKGREKKGLLTQQGEEHRTPDTSSDQKARKVRG